MYDRWLLGISTCVLLAFPLLCKKELHPYVHGNPNAPVHMTLLQEFSCPACQLLHNEVLPVIEEEFVQKGLVKITFVPLAFLDDSLPACNLALCTEKIIPEALPSLYTFFFDLPQDLLSSLSSDSLLSLYEKTHPEFLSHPIRNCLQGDRNEAIESNLDQARALYPDEIPVPIVLINGTVIQDPDITNLSKAIYDAL